MPSLAEVQSRVRDAILGADAGPLEGIVADDRLGFGARLGVYRNNTTILLTEALGANFPIVHDLVGEEFFANLSRGFVRTHPPQSPCLFEYGAGFADFLAHFPGTAELPYLPDVARLEWCINRGLYAENAAPLEPAQLAHVSADDYARLTFARHPAMHTVASDFPLHAIWALHQPDADQDLHIDLAAGGECVLITRPGVDVLIAKISLDEAAFIQTLADGATLAEAFVQAGPDFDAAQALTTILNQGAFTAAVLD